MWPISASFSSVTSAAEAKCCFGITRKCLGASGAMSMKREALIVLIDLRGRDFSRDDLTKQAIRHSDFLLISACSATKSSTAASASSSLSASVPPPIAESGLPPPLPPTIGRNRLDDIAGLDAGGNCVLAADCKQRHLLAVDRAEHRDDGSRPCRAGSRRACAGRSRPCPAGPAVTTLSSPTFLAENIRLSTSPAKTLSFIFSIVCCRFRISLHAALRLGNELARRRLKRFRGLHDAHVHFIDHADKRLDPSRPQCGARRRQRTIRSQCGRGRPWRCYRHACRRRARWTCRPC